MNCARLIWPGGVWAVLLGFLLLAAPAWAQDPPAVNDPAFDKYVDLDLLARAWNEKNAEMLTDIALQLVEGERVLLRPHKAVSADLVFAMAVKIAKEKYDNDNLKRLSKVLEASKKSEL